MTVETWNRLVAALVFLQFIACAAVIVLTESPDIMGAAMTWLVVIVPTTFGLMNQHVREKHPEVL